MIQLNGNVSGSPGTDPVEYVIDNGHRYTGVLESPSRMIFKTTQPEPSPYGSHIEWRGQILGYFAVPHDGFVGELSTVGGPYVLTFTPTLSRLQPDGVQFKGYTWAMMTGFCDYALWCRGQRDQLNAVWQQASDLGANGRRVFGMMAYITHFDPREYNHFYSELQPFARAAADYGLRLHFDVFADNQIYKLGLEHWAKVCDQLRPVESVVIGLGNEWPKNGFDPNAFPYPGVISSQGSTTSDEAPPMPGWGIRCFHGRRDYPKVFMSFDDAVYVGRGLDASGHQYAPVAPVIHDEPIGFAEVEMPGRRSTDPVLAQSLMLTGKAYGAGATLHVESGMYSRQLGPTEQTCARAFFDAQ